VFAMNQSFNIVRNPAKKEMFNTKAAARSLSAVNLIPSIWSLRLMPNLGMAFADW